MGRIDEAAKKMITVCTWLWGDRFGKEYVDRLREGVKRHMKQPYQWRVFRPEARDVNLTKIPGCFARLRMFDPKWQVKNGIEDRIVLMDLDTIITGPLDPLFDRPESFIIMQGGNAANPCRFNGALQMLRAGAHAEVWNDFSVEAAKQVPFYSYPDDQGWIWHKLPDAAGWVCGKESGVYVFRKPGWPMMLDDELPRGARLVTFNSPRSPDKFKDLAWIKEHWNA